MMYKLTIEERPTHSIIKEFLYQEESKAITDAHFFWNLLDVPAKRSHRVFVCKCTDKEPFWNGWEAICYLSLDIPI